MSIRRFRYWLTRTQRQADLRKEVELHIEEKTAELVASGVSEAAARAEALRRFGNIGIIREDSREVWIARWWSDFWQDVRYGVRGIQRDPGFAAIAIVSAALGIGACTTIFSVVNAATLRPLPVAQPDRLLAISGMNQTDGVGGQTMAFAEVRDIRSYARSWQDVTAFAPLLPGAIRPNGGEARQHWGFLVAGNYFDVVQPAFTLGGGFVDQEDDAPGASPKIVVTYALWVNRFGADRSIIGQEIQVNRRAMTVVGVTGPGFRGTEVTIKADFFLPFSQISEMQRLGENPERMTSYGSHWLYALGRLRAGVDAAQAEAELDAVSAGIRERNPNGAKDRAFHAERAGQVLPAMRQRVMPAFLLLLAVTVLVLLTACANIANLMLARASVRGKEIATRLAIGAGQGRIIRQLATESLLLAFSGGLFGVGLAALASRYIASFRLPLPVPIDLTAPIDNHVVLFAVGLSVATAIAFGLAPAFRASRSNLTGALRSEGGHVASLRRFGMRNALVVGQIAISAVLVICSGLFLRSLGATRSVDSGMETEDLTLVRFDPALNHYGQEETRRLLLDILARTEALPGIRTASVVDRMPLSFGGNFTGVSVEGRDESTRTAVMTVGPRYFETMGIPLLSGDEFGPQPSQETLVIVSQDLAAKLFPGQNAVGRYIVENERPVRILAVAANSKFADLQEAQTAPVLYRPILGSSRPVAGFGGLTLIVKAARNSGPLGETVRRRLLTLDPELVVNLAGTMESHIQESLFVPRLSAMLFGASGLMGLFIASIGIYGVVSFAVARRTREIGIRMALGARSAQVTRMVLRHGAVLALIGIAIGLAGGMALAATAGSLIYGVSVTDPLTFATVPVILLSVALLATAIPARRAARVDPNRTLRAE